MSDYLIAVLSTHNGWRRRRNGFGHRFTWLDIDLPNQGSNKTPKHYRTLTSTFWCLQLSKEVRKETELNIEKVEKNKEICVIFLGKQELSFRGHDESAGSKNRGNYLELLSLITESNTDLYYHQSTNKVGQNTKRPDHCYCWSNEKRDQKRILKSTFCHCDGGWDDRRE